MFEVCILHGYFLSYNVCLFRLGNVSISTSACLGSRTSLSLLVFL